MSYHWHRLHFSMSYQGPSWPWSYGNWIYNYLCIRCLSPLMLWVWLPLGTRCTTLCDKDNQWLVADRWFSPGPPVSSTNKTDRHDIAEILLKVALNTIKPTSQSMSYHWHRLLLSMSYHWHRLLLSMSYHWHIP